MADGLFLYWLEYLCFVNSSLPTCAALVLKLVLYFFSVNQVLCTQAFITTYIFYVEFFFLDSFCITVFVEM